MTQHTTILLLGSDLGDRENNLLHSKELIKSNVGEITKESEVLETDPIGFTSETKFLNQVLEVKTLLSPFELLKTIKSIENQMGRVYETPKNGEKYTSRIIDIDILFYDNLILQAPKLLIPHPQVYTRKFVSILLINIGFNC